MLEHLLYPKEAGALREHVESATLLQTEAKPEVQCLYVHFNVAVLLSNKVTKCC